MNTHTKKKKKKDLIDNKILQPFFELWKKKKKEIQKQLCQ